MVNKLNNSTKIFRVLESLDDRKLLRDVKRLKDEEAIGQSDLIDIAIGTGIEIRGIANDVQSLQVANLDAKIPCNR